MTMLNSLEGRLLLNKKQEPIYYFIKRIRPVIKFMTGASIIMFIATSIYGNIFPLLLLIIGIMIIILITIFLAIAETKDEKYYITNIGVFHKYELSNLTKGVNFGIIKKINIEQDFIDRLLNIGSLYFITVEKDDQIVFYGIKDPVQTKNLIEDTKNRYIFDNAKALAMAGSYSVTF